MYIITTLLMWSVAFLLIYMDPKSIKHRWLALTALMGGFLGICALLEENILPIIQNSSITNPYIEAFIRNLAIFFAITSVFYPYPLLMFSLNYSNINCLRIRDNQVKYSIILLIPIILLYLVSPIDYYYKPTSWLFTLWDITYVFGANIILLIGLIKEKSRPMIEERRTVLMMIVPITTASVIFGDIYYSYIKAWKKGTVFFIFMFILFIFYATRKSIMGIKLKLEKVKMDRDSSIMLNNTVFLNHALKNEIVKISKSIDNIYSSQREDWNVDIIKNSVEHLKNMINTVNLKTRDIQMKESIFNLDDALTEVVGMIDKRGEKKVNMHLKKEKVIIAADKVLLTEALLNIIQNSYEAIEVEGNIWINISVKKRFIRINVKDDGIGLSSSTINKIFDPYFTTKNPKQNYGLGLTYCRKVIEKHGGSIDVESQENEGTTFGISLPVKTNSYFI